MRLLGQLFYYRFHIGFECFDPRQPHVFDLLCLFGNSSLNLLMYPDRRRGRHVFFKLSNQGIQLQQQLRPRLFEPPDLCFVSFDIHHAPRIKPACFFFNRDPTVRILKADNTRPTNTFLHCPKRCSQKSLGGNSLAQPRLCWPSHQHERSSRLTLATPTHEVVHWGNPGFGVTIPARDMIPIPSIARAQSALPDRFGFNPHYSPASPVSPFLPPPPWRNSSPE